MFYRPHPPVYTPIGGESRTKQSHKAECDINNILKQFQRTGILQHINKNQPFYADLPADVDYQNSLAVIMRAEESFASLPSVVRRHFNNDPEAFLAAFSDPAQHEKLREWGLLKPPPTPRPADPQAGDKAAPATS